MKRQRGRGRKPGGGGGGGGHHHQHQGNRSLESTGPDVKIRGTAAQIYEKYAQYARDAQSGGDRVRYETYLQHAEHYFRVMAATMPRDRMFPQQGPDGQPMPPQQGGGELAQGENAGGEQPHDPLKVVDDGQGGDDDGDYEGDDDGGDDQQQDGDRVEARDGDNQGNNQNNNNNQQGRRRRRGRRNRPNDQNYNPNNNSPNPNNDGNTNNDPEARSALDSLARKQGAFAND